MNPDTEAEAEAKTQLLEDSNLSVSELQFPAVDFP